MSGDPPPLRSSRALWNRSRLDLRSDEILAQLLDRGEMDAWREVYRLASADPSLRRRIVQVVARVPIGFPRFWLAAMASLGETVDLGRALPEDRGV
jgi:hypothetical protein